jgi:hypothetical protein
MVLRFETDNSIEFSLSVEPDITIAQLKRDVLIQEKIDAKQLKALVFRANRQSIQMTTKLLCWKI